MALSIADEAVSHQGRNVGRCDKESIGTPPQPCLGLAASILSLLTGGGSVGSPPPSQSQFRNFCLQPEIRYTVGLGSSISPWSPPSMRADRRARLSLAVSSLARPAT